MNIKQKFAAATATAMMLSSVLTAGAFADNTVNISGNGDNSTNNVTLKKITKNRVRQRNTSTIGVAVNSTSDTGGNGASNNTNGTTNVTTGVSNTTNNVTVNGSTNSNTGVSCCCGSTGNNTVNVTDNGTDSTNNVTLLIICKNKVKQSNTSTIGVSVDSFSSTGGNTANGNTGGNTTVTTGGSNTTTNVTIGGSSNTNNSTP